MFHRYRGKRIVCCRTAWRTAIERAGLSHRVPHDLRRTAARNLINAGVDAKLVMALVGWESLASLLRYRFVLASDLAAAVSKLALRAPANASDKASAVA